MPELALTIRTPRGPVFEAPVLGLRVSTESGLVGLRPRGEPLALVVEPGLVRVYGADGEVVVGTVGGLLRADGQRCELFTPQAIVGAEDEVVEALEGLSRGADAELEARRRLGELEQRILTEMRRPRSGRRGGPRG